MDQSSWYVGLAGVVERPSEESEMGIFPSKWFLAKIAFLEDL